MNRRVLVFAGTTEGREVCEGLVKRGVEVTACVATEYGEICLSEISGLRILTGRRSETEIFSLVQEYDCVVDATHPFAAMISQNVQSACKKAGKRTIRVLRGETESACQNAEYFQSLEEVCSYLTQREGIILATTGSKELAPYMGVPEYQKRVYIRVLPAVSSLEACSLAGFSPKNIIAMQGPFSEELNTSLLKQIGARFLVTKESGGSGGFYEKLSAAEKVGVTVLVIGKPQQEVGVTVVELLAQFQEEAPLTPNMEMKFPLFVDISKKKILVVGGGSIAARRVQTLLRFGGQLTVVAPEISNEIEKCGERVKCFWREFRDEDLLGMDMVLAATDRREINHRVYLLCKQGGVSVNVCDRKEECEFYFPAVFEGDNLVGGLVSKNGAAHGMVKKAAQEIRQILRECVGNEDNSSGEQGQ